MGRASTQTSAFRRALGAVDVEDKLRSREVNHLAAPCPPWRAAHSVDAPLRIKVRRFPEEREDEVFVVMKRGDVDVPATGSPRKAVLQELHGRVTALDNDGFDAVMVDERGKDWLRRFDREDVAPDEREFVHEGAPFVWREVRPLVTPWRHRWELHFVPLAEVDDGLDDDTVVASILSAIETEAD